MIAGKNYWVYPSPAWPNIWGSGHHHPTTSQQAVLNRKKTHNGTHLLCLSSQGPPSWLGVNYSSLEGSSRLTQELESGNNYPDQADLTTWDCSFLFYSLLLNVTRSLSTWPQIILACRVLLKTFPVKFSWVFRRSMTGVELTTLKLRLAQTNYSKTLQQLGQIKTGPQ